MSFESDLYQRLLSVCPNVYPDFAPSNTARPFITYAQIGGSAIQPLGKEVPNRRLALVQVNVWSDTRSATTALMLQVDAAMRTATAFDAQANAEFMSVTDEETGLRGAIQDFKCVGYR